MVLPTQGQNSACGQIDPTPVFATQVLLGCSHPHWSTLLAMIAFMLQWQSCGVVTQVLWPVKPEYLSFGLFQEKLLTLV